MLWVLACALVLGAIPVGAALYAAWHLDHNLHRIDGAFNGLDHRPSRPTTGSAAKAVNILLFGADRRSDVPTTGADAEGPTWLPGAQRSDMIMVVHFAGDRRSAWVTSVPPDSWVAVPGHGHATIDAALSSGGPSLAVATVEQLTGVRIDHLAVMDWSGFVALTDAVGGVDIDVPDTLDDPARQITWTAGRQHLDGARALDYVGRRGGLPGGDLDRVARQQAFLRSLMQASLRQEMRTDPRLLYGFLDIVTQHLSVDSGWSVTDMARLMASLRGLRSAGIGYVTVPVAGLGREGAQSVVRLDSAAGRDLWQALRADRMEEWSEVHRRDLAPKVVN